MTKNLFRETQNPNGGRKLDEDDIKKLNERKRQESTFVFQTRNRSIECTRANSYKKTNNFWRAQKSNLYSQAIVEI